MASQKIFYVILFALVSLVISTEKIRRGVNIGGWLVLEPWITPSLFEQFRNTPYEKTAIDETTFNSRLGTDVATRQLEEHWTNFVTEDDFRKISEYGLNTVRIPFPWWIIHDGTGHVVALDHLDRGVELAKKYGIDVLLDLHAAPLSQNGFDNSGITCATSYRNGTCPTSCPKHYMWGLDVDQGFASFKLTIDTLKTIANRYKNYPNIWGIELVNEPRETINIDWLKGWYTEAYNELRQIVPNWQIVMHESFRPYEWLDFMNDRNKFPNVVMDTHIYFSFLPNVIQMNNPDEILNESCNAINQVTKMKASGQTVIVGEWSLGHDDCAKWLVGFRQAPTKTEKFMLSCDEVFNDQNYSDFIRNQLWAFEQSDGWIFWNFKNELEDNWSYFRAVERGWIPKDANTFPEWVKGSQCAKNISKNLK